MSVALVPVSRTLDQLEAVIDRGAGTFIAVGSALMEIRDGELYREAGHEDFTTYLRSKSWGFTRRRAYQLIEASAVGTIVHISNEGQARELAPLLRQPSPEVAVRQVYGEVLDEAGAVEKVTAAAIRVKVRAILPPKISKPGKNPARGNAVDMANPRNQHRAKVAKDKLHKVLAEINGHSDALEHFNLRLAVTSASPEDIAAWVARIGAATRALHQFKARLQEEARHAQTQV